MEVSCQCGAVQFTCPLPEPTCIYACHCTECRRQSGSAYGISAIFPVFTPQPSAAVCDVRKWSRVTQRGRTMNCYFCGKCGSRLWNAREGVQSISIKGGCLRGLNRELMNNVIHIWTAEAVVPIPDGVKQYTGEPPSD